MGVVTRACARGARYSPGWYIAGLQPAGRAYSAWFVMGVVTRACARGARYSPGCYIAGLQPAGRAYSAWLIMGAFTRACVRGARFSGSPTHQPPLIPSAASPGCYIAGLQPARLPAGWEGLVWCQASSLKNSVAATGAWTLLMVNPGLKPGAIFGLSLRDKQIVTQGIKPGANFELTGPSASRHWPLPPPRTLRVKIEPSDLTKIFG